MNDDPIQGPHDYDCFCEECEKFAKEMYDAHFLMWNYIRKEMKYNPCFAEHLKVRESFSQWRNTTHELRTRLKLEVERALEPPNCGSDIGIGEGSRGQEEMF